ncbi:MAG: hypothetical protein V4773_10720 [Verrucomicrobiota bacterium]
MKRGVFLACLALLAGLVAAVVGIRHGDTRLLRADLALARLERDEVDRLRAAQSELAEKQPSPPALATLRADHAAVQRLRAELESLKHPLPPRAP